MSNEKQTGGVLSGYYVAALIDILGQKEQLAEIGSLTWSFGQETRMKELTTACCQRLKLVRSLFTRGCQISETNAPRHLDLTEEQQEQLNRINAFEPAKYQGFGDTVIAYTPVKNHNGELTMQAVAAFLGGCALTILMCLEQRVPIRGAIDVGLGFDCFEGEIYGPVLLSVHQLEDKIAEYPRIVVGPGLLGYLRFQANRSQASLELEDRYNKAVADSCIELIQSDLDGVPILNYAGPAMQVRLSAWAEMSNTVSKADEFVRQEYDKFLSAGDRKVALRYALLLRYLNSQVRG